MGSFVMATEQAIDSTERKAYYLEKSPEKWNKNNNKTMVDWIRERFAWIQRFPPQSFSGLASYAN